MRAHCLSPDIGRLASTELAGQLSGLFSTCQKMSAIVSNVMESGWSPSNELFCLFYLLFKTGFFCVALEAVLELAL